MRTFALLITFGLGALAGALIVIQLAKDVMIERCAPSQAPSVVHL